LNLQNALGYGEVFDLEFKSYPGNATTFKTHFLYPYLPLLPIGLDLKFDLYVRDTLYRDVNTFVGFQYIFSGNNYLKAFADVQNSDLLSIDSLRIAQQQRLPNTLDLRRTFYGLEYNFEQLDYRFNPRKGWYVQVNAAVGNRRTRVNNAIIAIDKKLDSDTLQRQYEVLNERALQFKGRYEVGKYWALGNTSTLKTALEGAYITQTNLNVNEQYRIGGNQRLRGFDEESIFADTY
ncbi:MAG: BamA/TamA family outer membrane protein, partial [Chitinophagales bacterium]